MIGPRTAESMARMLQAVVSTEGTAGKIALPGYQLAGKTGTAQKIVDWRATHAPFRSVEDLDAVPGIGPARVEQLRDLVTP